MIKGIPTVQSKQKWVVDFEEPATGRAVRLRARRAKAGGLLVELTEDYSNADVLLANLEHVGLGSLLVHRSVATAPQAPRGVLFEAATSDGSQRLAEWEYRLSRTAAGRTGPGHANGTTDTTERISEPVRIRRLLSCLWDDPREALDALGQQQTVDREFEYSTVRIPAANPGRLPPFLDRVRRRRHRRVRLDPRVSVTGTHPELAGVKVRGTANDVSVAGLSFYASQTQNVVWPGLELRLAVGAERGRSSQVDCVVRHVSPTQTPELRLVGVELTSAPDSFAKDISRILYARSAAGTATPETLWSIYDESGYFQLSGKTTADFAKLRGPFVHANAKLSNAAPVGTHIVSGDTDVTMHQLQQWPGAWLLYHVSRRRQPQGVGEVGAGALYEAYRHAYEYVREHGAQWLVTYVQKSATWSRKVHVDVPAEFVSSGEASVTEFSAYEVPTDVQVTAPDGVLVRELVDSDLPKATAAFTRDFTRPYISALGLDTLTQPADRDGHWSAGGLERRRVVMVAEVDGEASALSILDATEEGLHLFRLTDSCRLYSLDGALHPGAFAALLAHACQWFSGLGRSHFVHFAREDEALLLEIDRVVSLGDAWMTVLNASHGPDLIERIREFVTRPHPMVHELDAEEEHDG
ncbi:MAG: PilZ domain-containing protein [Nannocystales bacterium]